MPDREQFDTADEFAAWYAANGKTTPERLRFYGRFPEPCDCGDEICTGWGMVHAQSDAIFEYEMETGHAPKGQSQ